MCVCRMKERAKRAGALRKEEESERKSLQVVTVQIKLLRCKTSVLGLLFSSISLFDFSHLGHFFSVRSSWNRQKQSSKVCLRSSRA